MRIFTLSVFIALTINSFGQIGLGFYDLPYWGDTYYRNVIPNISSAMIPKNVSDSSDSELYWDLSGIGGDLQTDTANYFWVEGTPAAFDFPDANMADYNPNANNGQYQYFIKNETGFYFSGQSGGFATQQGTFDIKAEFRPAVPIIKVPARLGDQASETSRSSVDLLTFGNVKLTTKTHYIINGFGTVKIPGGEEFEVLRIERETESEVIFSIKFGEMTIEDTTLTTETAWEFYTSGYGDAIAKVTKTFDEQVGLDQYAFSYKKDRVKSSINEAQNVKNMSLIYLNNYEKIIVNDADLANGGLVKVIDLNGREIRKINASSSTISVNSSDLNGGVYVISTTGKNGISESKTLVINK